MPLTRWRNDLLVLWSGIRRHASTNLVSRVFSFPPRRPWKLSKYWLQTPKHRLRSTLWTSSPLDLTRERRAYSFSRLHAPFARDPRVEMVHLWDVVENGKVKWKGEAVSLRLHFTCPKFVAQTDERALYWVFVFNFFTRNPDELVVDFLGGKAGLKAKETVNAKRIFRCCQMWAFRK